MTHMITESQWWRDAVSGKSPKIFIGEPHPGYYRRRLVSGGVWVPARIWFGPPADPWTGELLDRSHRLQCEVAGEMRDPLDQWSWLAGRPISKDEYCHLQRLKQWAEKYDPAAPEATPASRINLSQIPSVF